MMNMLRLAKLQLKVGFGLSALKWYFRNSPLKFWGGVGIVLVVILAIMPIFILYLRLVQGVFDTALMLGQPQVVLTMAMVLSAFLVFIFGIAYVMSAFYFARDLPVLVPLPLLPRDILGAKFAQVLVSDYLTIIPFFLPALIVYGLRSGEGLLYWLVGVLIFFLLPLIPLTLATVLILPLMRLTNISRRKDTVRMVGLVGMLALVVGLNSFLSQVPPGEEAEFVQRLLADEGLVYYMARAFPPAAWATVALTAGGFKAVLNGAGLLALSGAGLLAMFYLGDRLFYHGLIGSEETHSRKKLSGDVLEKRISKTSSPIMAIASREIKTLIRTPIYLFNSVGIFVLLPVIMLIPAASGGGLAPLIDMVRSQEARVMVNLGGAAFMGVMALFAPAASSSFSREGRTFWISKVIPVPPGQQIRGKMAYSFLLTFLALPLLLIFSFLTVRWSLGELLLVFLLGTALAFPAISLSLLVDMMRPFLDWDNPQRAIKQNANVLIAMVAGGAQFYLIYLLVNRVLAAAGDLWVYAGVFLGAVALGLISYLAMMRLADARYRDIQV